MPVTIREIAKAAGVSIATVSRSLNNAEHPINEETKQRVLKIAAELGYRPNQAARNLRMDRSMMIGIITDAENSPHSPHIPSPHTPIIIQGLQDTFRQQGYYCMVINAYWDPTTEQKEINSLLSHSVEGVVFVETWLSTASSILDLANKPYVFAHRLFGTPKKNSIVTDDTYGGRLAINHLIKLGHRRIGHISGPKEYYASAERLQGYQTELVEAGIPFDPTLVEACDDWQLPSGYQAAQRLLENSSPPTAIFAANDRMALGAIHAIQDAGLRVPEDIAVVGYDNEELAALVRPSITTVSLPRYEIGQAGARLLKKLINREIDDSEELKIKGELIIRQSCGTYPEQ
ncbi:MAG: LacI family transcriptional regulator [Chloroflexi bacterium]|nr:MAG: LacI family transcriptional regulator [Chloroflexota bacterium]